MKRMLAAVAGHPVFANLLMIFLIISGLVALSSITREMFPEFSFDNVVVTVAYPGATPAEVEESVTIKIEEAVRSLDGVRKVESVSSEGVARITIEVDSDARDPQDVLVDVRNEISRITTFPEDVKEPNVKLVVNRREVALLTLSGDVDEESLTILAKDLEQDLLLLPEVNEVNVQGIRPYEIAILVSEAKLQRHHLSFAMVTNAIRNASLDLPLGKLRSEREEQLLRVQALRQVGRELREIPVHTRDDGTRILLQDVAEIQDGFVEDPSRVRLDGKRAITFQVQRTSDQDTIHVAETVKAFQAEKQEELPEGVELELWKDGSLGVVDRLGLLSRNGLQGLALVFAALLLFLGIRLSFWVAFGLPVAFLAALVFLLAFGGSLNMVSSFALIMILGILVDDSIVVAENIARHMKEGGYTLESAVAGLHEVTWPVVTSVTTTAIAFMPLLFLPGIMGKFIRIMPVAVVACLLASLVECLLILPAHLAHAQAPGPRQTKLQRFRTWFDGLTERFIQNRYGPTIDWSVRNRYVVLALALAFSVTIAGLVASGRPGFIFFPRLDSEYVEAKIVMPQGTSFADTVAVTSKVEAAARQLRSEFGDARDGKPIIRQMQTRAGLNGVHEATVELELAKSGDRDVTHLEILKRWKELTGDLPQARSVSFEGRTHRPGGRPIELRITTPNPEQGAAASQEVREALVTYPGVFNIDDNLEPGKRELRFVLRPEADSVGLTPADMAGQLQSGFLGREVHKVQRGRDEVEVRVRYDADLRERQHQLDDMRLRASGGSSGTSSNVEQGAGLIPLDWAADIERGRGLSRIERRNGRRIILVTADVDDSTTNANQVVTSLNETLIPELEERYPGSRYEFGGAQEEQREIMTRMVVGFSLAMLGIYTILALLFSSYIQPLVVMMVVPLGFCGAVLGHIVFGFPLMIFSVFGMVGLTGIVVNDSLVLIDFINRRRRAGASVIEAATTTGRVRFRAVFLTTITTVFGLLPLLLETSLSAQFVIPMAISIASGVAVATFLTLYVVPCAYVVVEDMRSWFYYPPATRE